MTNHTYHEAEAQAVKKKPMVGRRSSSINVRRRSLKGRFRATQPFSVPGPRPLRIEQIWIIKPFFGFNSALKGQNSAKLHQKWIDRLNFSSQFAPYHPLL